MSSRQAPGDTPSKFTISCLGILVADIVVSPVDRAPESDTLATVEEVSLHGGGSALNTASVLSMWGQEVTLVGRVGEDLFGDWLLEVIAERGFHRTVVARDPSRRTSVSVVLVDRSSNRSFLHHTGANASIALETLDIEVMKDVDALHIGGALVMPSLDGEPMASLLQIASREGLLTSLDITFDPTGSWDRIKVCLPHCGLFAAALREAQAITGETSPARVAGKLLQLGAQRIALKMGDQGAWVADANRSLHVPAVKVRALDGTGAGDAFCAGMIYGTLDGWSVEESARFANAAGAMAASEFGAYVGVGSFAETIRVAASTGWSGQS